MSLILNGCATSTYASASSLATQPDSTSSPGFSSSSSSNLPISTKVQMGNLEALKQYLTQGNDINKPVKMPFVTKPFSLLQYAIIGYDAPPLPGQSKANQWAVINYLLDKGANPNLVTDVGTALDTATSPRVIRLLLDRGADPAVVNRHSENAYEFHHRLMMNFAKLKSRSSVNPAVLDSLVTKHREAARILREAMDEQSIPLLKFARQGNLDKVKALLNSGQAKINETNHSGVNAAHMAAMGGQTEVIQYLVARGIQLKKKNNQGETPLDLAISGKHIDTAKYIGCRLYLGCRSVAQFEKYIALACAPGSSEARCGKAMDIDVYGVFTTDDMKNRVVEYKFNNSCKTFNYKKCYQFTQQYAQTSYASSAQLLLDQHRSAIEPLLDKSCGKSGSLSRCKNFVSNYPDFANDKRVKFGLAYLNQPCRVNEDGWLYKSGHCVNKVVQGKGEAIKPDKHLLFVGSFSAGIRTRGKIYYNNIPMFDGPIKNGRPDGKGVCFYEGSPEECRYYEGKRIDAIYKNRLALAEQRAFYEKQNAEQKKEMAALRRDVNAATQAVQYQQAGQSTGSRIGDALEDSAIHKASDVVVNKVFDKLF